VAPRHARIEPIAAARRDGFRNRVDKSRTIAADDSKDKMRLHFDVPVRPMAFIIRFRSVFNAAGR
jgi:hypothetical protein